MPTTLPIAAPPVDDDLVALDEALTRFAQVEPQKAELVKLRYFAGLTIEEAAEALGISPATAKRHWAYSKAWLFQAMGGGGKNTSRIGEPIATPFSHYGYLNRHGDTP